MAMSLLLYRRRADGPRVTPDRKHAAHPAAGATVAERAFALALFPR